MSKYSYGFLAGAALCLCLCGFSISVFAAAPGPSAAPLSGKQVAAFRDTLKTTMGAIPPDSVACGTSEEKAASSAIASNLVAAINADGTGSASELASMVIQQADDYGFGSCLTGHALAEAAVTLSAYNEAAARQIASPVANQGTRALSDSFSDALRQSGGARYIDVTAGESPAATPEISSDPTMATPASSSPMATPPAPCPNPSCT